MVAAMSDAPAQGDSKEVPRWIQAYFRAVCRTRWLIIVFWLALTACGGWKAGDFFDATSGDSDKVWIGPKVCSICFIMHYWKCHQWP